MGYNVAMAFVTGALIGFWIGLWIGTAEPITVGEWLERRRARKRIARIVAEVTKTQAGRARLASVLEDARTRTA